MASIQKRKNSFVVIYRYTNDNGESKQKWEAFDTLKKARARKAEIENKIEIGTFIAPSVQNVREFLESFIELYGLKEWSLSTYARNKRLINNYINPILGDLKIQEVNALTIEKYYHQLLRTPSTGNKIFKESKNISAGTVNQIHRLLKCAFGVAETWDLVGVNVIKKVKPPKHVYAKRDIWNSNMIIEALDACEDPKLAVAIHLAFACSLRLGEVLGLQWKNVHITDEEIANEDAHINVECQLESVSAEALEALGEKGVIEVLPSRSTRGNKLKWVLKKPKTETSIRKIWLPNTLAYLLREWKEEQKKYQEFFQDEYYDFGLVVCYEDGWYCSHNVIRHGLNHLIEKTGLPPIVFHSLRHTSTTYKLKLNHGDIKATQGDTGHAQADMVTEVYSHILDEDRKLNAKKFDETFYTQSGNGMKDQENKTVEVDVDKLVSTLQKNPELMNQLVEALKK
ncbi:site-specific integrase [[Eubacterium] hominis]|uniref:site-specific integrase n=1 Tax=[Eubacterium] hominis TaxID=2764325 RepID=UPI003A4D7250